MPNKYQVKRIPIKELLLDAENPRFIGIIDKGQDSIMDYLLKNEEIIDLARSISSYNGLMPGEFPIVCVENDHNIVVEGNRRVCSCKILLDPNLAPAEFRASIPRITKETRISIKRIQVHIINSREDAQIVLGTRHIQGVKKWPSVSKFMFFAKHFESGKPIKTIKALTGVGKSTIIKSLKKHYFLQYILSLDCWTEVEKQNLLNYASLHKIGVDRILRIFGTEGSSVLHLTYNDQYKPASELPEFGKIVEHIVRRVLKILPGKKEVTTRTNFSDILTDIQQWLPKSATTSASKPKPDHHAEFYLENLAYNIPLKNKEDRALVKVCEEIKIISKGGAYRQYPLATSYLTRALIEHTCKRYLRNKDNATYNKICPQGKDSSLTIILQQFCNNKGLFTDKNYHRLFVSLFPNGAGIKDMMDLNMHHPGLSMPTGAVLEGWVSSGLKELLEYLLK
jgi:hypothetical protein